MIEKIRTLVLDCKNCTSNECSEFCEKMLVLSLEEIEIGLRKKELALVHLALEVGTEAKEPEPKEARECVDVADAGDEFACSDCGIWFEYEPEPNDTRAIYYFDGEEKEARVLTEPNFCPNCGARIVK